MLFPTLLEIATHRVRTLEDHHTLEEALHVLDRSNLRDIVITGSQGWRMLTARELMAFELQQIPFDRPLAELSLQPVCVLPENKTVLDALIALKQSPFDYVCLQNSVHQLSGIVSYTDLVNHLDP